MKKNFKNFLLLSLLVAIGGAMFIALLENVLGVVVVYVSACILTAVVGLSILIANTLSYIKSLKTNHHEKS